MADKEQISRLRGKGVIEWNIWRLENRGHFKHLIINLSEAEFTRLYRPLEETFTYGHSSTTLTLRGIDLRFAKLNKTNFSYSDLEEANFWRANLQEALMEYTMLYGANFIDADLRGARLRGAKLNGAILRGADLSGADLTDADLSEAILVGTNLQDAILTNCKVYGLSAWNLKGKPKIQSSFIITQNSEPKITVDDLQVAQFIYLLLNREKLRNIFDTINSKAVLILGRFNDDRKEILDAIAEELRRHELIPIIFDFQRPTLRDFTETIKTLAGMSLFIIADITSPKSSPLELQAIVPDYQVPLIPIIAEGEIPFSMLSDLIGKYEWVLDRVITYSSKEKLIKGFKEGILNKAWEMHKEMVGRKATEIKTQSIDDFIKVN